MADNVLLPQWAASKIRLGKEELEKLQRDFLYQRPNQKFNEEEATKLLNKVKNYNKIRRSGLQNHYQTEAAYHDVNLLADMIADEGITRAWKRRIRRAENVFFKNL